LSLIADNDPETTCAPPRKLGEVEINSTADCGGWFSNGLLGNLREVAVL
jgi:hypothetical protein